MISIAYFQIAIPIIKQYVSCKKKKDCIKYKQIVLTFVICGWLLNLFEVFNKYKINYF